jgi:hypothetical protein
MLKNFQQGELAMQTYAFTDVQATLQGPGGTIALGSGAGAAEEGISIEAVEETDTMHIGADGKVAHSLHASRAAKVIVRLLKTSPVNNLLQTMYNFQRTSSSLWGQSTLLISNLAFGDVYTCQGVAFTRLPRNNYSKEAGAIEWEFNVSQMDPNLGTLIQ